MRIPRLIKWTLLGAGGAVLAVVVLVFIAVVWHFSLGKEKIVLESEGGRVLLEEHAGADYTALEENFEPQLRMHCYPASAVIVMNSLQPGMGYTQEGLFTPETADIITQDEVYQGQFTLAKLAEVIRVRSGLRVEYYHAGTGESEHDYTEFLSHLVENQINADNRMIITYAPGFVSLGTRLGFFTKMGHGSPVAAFNGNAGMVLMLEVDGRKEPFWISAADIYEAMNTVDPVSNEHRGWLMVSKN